VHAPAAPDETLDGLLLRWRWTCRTANVAHLRATDSLTFRNLALGGTSVVLGALVGLGVFATLQSSHVSLGIRVAAGIAAFAAAASAALWKNLNYAPRIEQHRHASRSYGNMVRQLDRALDSKAAITDDLVKTIDTALDHIDNLAPNVSAAIWIWAVTGVGKERRGEVVDASTIDRGLWSRLTRLRKRLFG
jgi:hypothetical protein